MLGESELGLMLTSRLAQILHDRSEISNLAPRADAMYDSILERLKNAWHGYDSTPECIAISSNVFQVQDGAASYLSKVASEESAALALDLVSI